MVTINTGQNLTGGTSETGSLAVLIPEFLRCVAAHGPHVVQSHTGRGPGTCVACGAG